MTPSAPVNPYGTADSPPGAAENGHTPPRQMQMSPTAEVKMTLFHWQVQQEAQRIEGVPPDLLNGQDTDGDTYVMIKTEYYCSW